MANIQYQSDDEPNYPIYPPQIQHRSFLPLTPESYAFYSNGFV